jgi:hypothetical protein
MVFGLAISSRLMMDDKTDRSTNTIEDLFITMAMDSVVIVRPI